ncbi:thyrotropin-releasing hormone receptor-like [Mytilus californianus]|uniref:thyrotropin-releasing hormone receptor-like n=1 Tax=Mytilus californianus TaxID=6549 RepID=UPI00224854A2|nr:thyrotropin-releasing hormone receptor-like [Mytilus californianus]
MNFTETEEDIISRMTNEAILQRIPCIIYIGVLSFIGIIGNIHVLILFSRADRKPSTYTVFVIALSIVDLVACVVHMPMEILDLTKPYTFYNEVGCRLFRFNNAFLLMSSISILVCIALERYRRVCNPMKTQMTVLTSKRLCVLAMCLSLIITLPMFFLNGHHVVSLEGNGANATGYMCFINDDFHGTLFLYSYLGFMIIVFIICSTILICANFSISKVVFSRHANIRESRKLSEDMRQNISTIARLDSVQSNISNSSKHVELYRNLSAGTMKTLRLSTLKTTRSLIVITGIFIIVFAPYLVLSCVISLDIEFKSGLSYLELTVYQIGIRLLLINNVSNPFVYGFTDDRFKNGIQSFYCRRKQNK